MVNILAYFRTVQINPDESPVYYYLGIFYQLMGADEMATDNLLKFKRNAEYWEEEYPNDPVTFLAKGTLLSRLGNISEGMEAGRKSYELDTANHLNYAKMLAVAYNKQDALRNLEVALEKGYRNHCWLKMDPDLSSLQEDERF